MGRAGERLLHRALGAGEIRTSLRLVTVTVRSVTGTLSLHGSRRFRLPGCLLLMLEELELGLHRRSPSALWLSSPS